MTADKKPTAAKPDPAGEAAAEPAAPKARNPHMPWLDEDAQYAPGAGPSADVPTVRVVGQDGQPLTINAADYDPRKHKLWRAPAA